MYVIEHDSPDSFIRVAKSVGEPVHVVERAVALPVREQGGVVMRVALQRHFSITRDVPGQGPTRDMLTETIFEHGQTFTTGGTALEKLVEAGVSIRRVGHVSGSLG
jgi:hypothetical protein